MQAGRHVCFRMIATAVSPRFQQFQRFQAHFHNLPSKEEPKNVQQAKQDLNPQSFVNVCVQQALDSGLLPGIPGLPLQAAGA
jgi:hypothetical protein